MSQNATPIPSYYYNTPDGEWFKSRGTGTSTDFDPHDRAYIEYHTGMIKRIYRDTDGEFYGVTLDRDNPQEVSDYLEMVLQARPGPG